ncbi:hypothetical protein [Amycolatopsis minnesotensis]|uniref:Uncharacterized protein n=1 Tax=Amycolatopsis minnesotensis TaxID=337894 RepID=A0ABP5BB87_9PSEU
MVDDGARREQQAVHRRAVPKRHGGGYPPGWHVRYRERAYPMRRRPGEPNTRWCETTGVVIGRGLRDVHTNTTWVPVRPDDAPEDTPARLVRATDILDATPPDAPGIPAPRE